MGSVGTYEFEDVSSTLEGAMGKDYHYMWEFKRGTGELWEGSYSDGSGKRMIIKAPIKT